MNLTASLNIQGTKRRLNRCLFQVGFMNDGRIVAADMQYYINAGNTADESLLVCKSAFIYR